MNSRDLFNNKIDNSRNDRMNNRLFSVTNPYIKQNVLIDKDFMINSRSQKNKPQQQFDNYNNDPNNVNLDRMAFNNVNDIYEHNDSRINNMRFADYTVQNSNRKRESAVRQRLIPEMRQIEENSKGYQQTYDNDIYKNKFMVDYGSTVDAKDKLYENQDNPYKNMSFDKFNPNIKY